MLSFRLGDRGPAVAEIRGLLRDLSLLAPAADDAGDEFDRALDSAVRAFQQQRGLVVDGIVGAQTFRALDGTRWTLGDRLLHHAVTHPFVGDDVADLQQRLLDLGFDPGRCDGVFEERTARALAEFQRNVGLSGDGALGPATIRAIAQLRRAVTGGRPQALRELEALARGGHGVAGKVVVVDPGHGGDDPGVSAHGLTEAEVAFDIAARLEGRLAAAGAHVFLTRSPEGGGSDTERAAFANAAEADLLVAVHLDGQPSSRAQGAATYYYGAGPQRWSPTGRQLANLVQDALTRRTDLRDCRAHAKSWELLLLTRMPAVQVEPGYLTNPRDAARLAQGSFRDAVADAVFSAVQSLYAQSPVEAPSGADHLVEVSQRSAAVG